MSTSCYSVVIPRLSVVIPRLSVAFFQGFLFGKGLFLTNMYHTSSRNYLYLFGFNIIFGLDGMIPCSICHWWQQRKTKFALSCGACKTCVAGFSQDLQSSWFGILINKNADDVTLLFFCHINHELLLSTLIYNDLKEGPTSILIIVSIKLREIKPNVPNIYLMQKVYRIVKPCRLVCRRVLFWDHLFSILILNLLRIFASNFINFVLVSRFST